ncbi:MAG: site-specific DNA-methyltransferase [Candidatus Bathyarchaeota archaeon]|nr:site-specific DNA-methyltransferase [Candidatus Bathyarchaeota archaeon]
MTYEHVRSYELRDSWKETNRTWGHSLHSTCSRTGSFPPSLAHFFIKKFSSLEGKVLDPFSGKGTAPLEACLAGRIGIGNDIAPEAFILTHSKVRPVSLMRFQEYLQGKKKEIDNTIEDVDVNEVADNVEVFYHPETLRQIIAVKNAVKNDNSDEGIFLKALMCGILHGSSEISLSLPCSHSYSMSPNYVKEYTKKHNLIRPKRNVIHCLIKKAKTVLSDGLPQVRGRAYQLDARSLPLENEFIDLIVTSPPYFNAQTYAWDNWLRLWFLGYDFKEVRKKLVQTGSKRKYGKFLKESMREMFRVLDDNRACFIVVGDVKIGEETINTAEFLAPLAESVGFSVRHIIDDTIPKESKYLTYVAEKDKGITIDRILALEKGDVRQSDEKIDWDVPLSSSPQRMLDRFVS